MEGVITITEKDLVLEYKLAKDEVERLEDESKKAKHRFEVAQAKLVEDLRSKGASKTAKYDGVGTITLMKPSVGARSVNEDALFDYLKQIGRDDLIKPTVHHKTLSSFVKEMLDGGQEIPDFIEFWFKESTRLTK